VQTPVLTAHLWSNWTAPPAGAESVDSNAAT
jgi:hypothetical protein